MKQCPQCNTQNNSPNIYCAICGMFLEKPVADPTWPQSSIINMHSIPPPPPLTPYANTKSIDPYSTIFSLDSPTSVGMQKRSIYNMVFRQTINMIFSIILYLSGFTCSVVGVCLAFYTLSSLIASIFLICMFVINIVVLIITLKCFHTPRLRWWQRLIWSLGATFIVFIMQIIVNMILTVLHMTGAQDTVLNLIAGLLECVCFP